MFSSKTSLRVAQRSVGRFYGESAVEVTGAADAVVGASIRALDIAWSGKPLLQQCSYDRLRTSPLVAGQSQQDCRSFCSSVLEALRLALACDSFVSLFLLLAKAIPPRIHSIPVWYCRLPLSTYDNTWRRAGHLTKPLNNNYVHIFYLGKQNDVLTFPMWSAISRAYLPN